MTYRAAVLIAVVSLAMAIILVTLPRMSARGRLRDRRDRGRLPADVLRRLARTAQRSRPLAMAVAAGGGAVTGAILGGGAVGAAALAGYVAYGVRAALLRRAGRIADRSRAAALDAVTALADDLRAGLAPATALGRAWPHLVGTGGTADDTGISVIPEDPVRALRSGADSARSVITGRLASAWQLAERTGTPLADLLDRLDAELVARERLRRKAEAQTAGTRATAVLLAFLPVVGIALGYGIGADPLRVLLRTPIGAALVAATMGLQWLGTWWAGRLAGDGVREAST